MKIRIILLLLGFGVYLSQFFIGSKVISLTLNGVAMGIFIAGLIILIFSEKEK